MFVRSVCLYTSIVNEVELDNSLRGFILIRLVNLKLFCHEAAPIITSSAPNSPLFMSSLNLS